MNRSLIAVIFGVLVGLSAGIGGFTFLYAKGYSYLTNNPAACANCHVMQDYYDGWIKSSHRSVAACNDCHTPASLVPKYAVKASNGFWHSFYFTYGGFHEPIEITKRDRQITENACRKCHQEIVYAIEGTHASDAKRFSCIRCHGAVGHQGAPGTLASKNAEEMQ